MACCDGRMCLDSSCKLRRKPYPALGLLGSFLPRNLLRFLFASHCASQDNNYVCVGRGCMTAAAPRESLVGSVRLELQGTWCGRTVTSTGFDVG